MGIYKDFLSNIQDPSEKMANANKIPEDYKLIQNITQETWSYENESGICSETFDTKYDALYNAWSTK